MQDGNMRDQVPTPYATNNGALAITLSICGVPFLKFGGVDYPGFNVYSQGFLTERGYPKGYKASVAVKELFDKGIPGQIVYHFQRVPGSPLIEEITTAWDNMAKLIDQADSGHPDAMAGAPSADCAVVAAICCQFVKARKEFYGDKSTVPLWRRRDPKGNLFIPACRASEGAGRTEHDGQRTIHYGSMTLKSVKV